MSSQFGDPTGTRGFAGAMSSDFERGPSHRTCHRCGEVGHFARDCTNNRSPWSQEEENMCGSPWKKSEKKKDNECTTNRACYKCSRQGHLSRDCPEGRGRNENDEAGGGFNQRETRKFENRERVGEKFGQRGSSGFGLDANRLGQENFGRRQGPEYGSGIGRGRIVRQQDRHQQAGRVEETSPFRRLDLDDEESPSRGGGFTGTCNNCGEEGHMRRHCPRASGRGELCRRCGQRGHFARDCTGPQKCFNCNEEGHVGRECPNPRAPRPGFAAKPGPVTYIPLNEISDEGLFQQGSEIAAGEHFDDLFKPKVEVSGTYVPRKLESFRDAGLLDQLFENVKRSGYQKPTPIQSHALPVIQNGRDVMGCAQTGSGKTAAYLLPVLNSVLTRSDRMEQEDGPSCIILAPTRELARQILMEAKKFSYATVLRCHIAYGGVSVQHQLDRLRSGCHLLVCTPGRMMQFVKEGHVGLNRVRYLVLDEADRMLDMGFEPEIRALVKDYDMPDKGRRQTLMFSATFPPEIQNLAKDFLRDFVFLTVGKVGCANTDICQSFEMVRQVDKKDRLKALLKEDMANAKDENGHYLKKTLVFVERKRVADFLGTALCQENFMSMTIHSDREQSQREEALRDFKGGTMPILIATDVASRGLDIKGVDHVINYDLPQTIEAYIHRIGRTGRVGNAGRATSFYEPTTDGPLAEDLVQTLRDAQQNVPDWLLQEAKIHMCEESFFEFGLKENSENERKTGDFEAGAFGGASKEFGTDLDDLADLDS